MAPAGDDALRDARAVRDVRRARSCWRACRAWSSRTADPKAGAAGSVFDILARARLNHRPKVESGLMADEAAALLRDFFAERRD